MSAPKTLPFIKMNGAGNSILVVDERGRPPAMTGAAARRIAESELSFDQMMVVADAAKPGFDATVRIYNTDGSRAGACGNGTRCVAWVMLEGRRETVLRLDIEGTDVRCERDAETMFTVDMGRPRFDWRDVPLRAAMDTRHLDLGADYGLPSASALSMGNPHAVFFVPDAGAIDLGILGPRLEFHPLFPDRANISFAQIVGPDHILLRVWERGAGATLACGSAACATLVSASRLGLTGRGASVSLPGGELSIVWREDDHVTMTGPVEVEHRGWLTLPEVAPA